MSTDHIDPNTIADYRSGVLNRRKRTAVEAHTAECATCARELQSLDDVLALVEENAPRQDPPDGIWGAVADRITSAEQPDRQPAFGWLWTLRLAVVGALAIVLAIGFMLSGGGHDTIAPMKLPPANEYVQSHALYAGQAPLADRVSYLSIAAASEVQTK